MSSEQVTNDDDDSTRAPSSSVASASAAGLAVAVLPSNASDRSGSRMRRAARSSPTIATCVWCLKTSQAVP